MLCSWRDSSLEAIRGVYQLFKRMIAIMFMAYTSDGNTNPIWKTIGYDWNAARKDLAVDSPEQEATTALLRKLVCLLIPYRSF